MPHRRDFEQEHKENLRLERRQQLAASILLAAIVLLYIVLHAGVRNVFPPGWWRF